MKISARSVLMAGVTTLTVSAVVSPRRYNPPAPHDQRFNSRRELSRRSRLNRRPTSAADTARPIRHVCSDPQCRFGTLPPTPAPIRFAIAPNLADTIDGIYIAVEPWVEYGFEVAT